MGRRTLARVLAVAVVLGTAVACGDDGRTQQAGGPSGGTDATVVTNGPPPSVGSAPRSSLPPSRLDGVLTIGTLLPRVGPGNQLGIAGINAVNVGVEGINAAGGVLGQPVRTVGADEGETVEDARSGIEALLAADVDAVIGPASSVVALEVLDELLDAGIVVCSPTATAMALNDFPDRQRFFRTVPSDSLTAQSMAVAAANTGVDTFAVVYVDDRFGRPMAEQAVERLADETDAEINEVSFPPATTTEQLAAAAEDVAELAPRTVLLIADAAQGWAMIEAMAGAFGSDPPITIVNDALRDPPDLQTVIDLPADFREAIQGISPVVPPAPPEPAGAYATNALDCLNLIALATVAAGSDDPAAIAAEMIGVSVAGVQCNSFAQCVGFLEDNRTINYQGANSLDLSPRGDPARGRMGAFDFDQNGLDVPTGSLTITEA